MTKSGRTADRRALNMGVACLPCLMRKLRKKMGDDKSTVEETAGDQRNTYNWLSLEKDFRDPMRTGCEGRFHRCGVSCTPSQWFDDGAEGKLSEFGNLSTTMPKDDRALALDRIDLMLQLRSTDPADWVKQFLLGNPFIRQAKPGFQHQPSGPKQRTVTR